MPLGVLRSLPPVQTHNFSSVAQAEISRSAFSRDHTYKTAFDSQYLIPIYVDEALPGDTFTCDMQAVARMTTPLFPILDNLHMDFFFFSCPNRLLWENWEKFQGARDDPGDSIDFTVPQVTVPVGGWSTNSLADYFGLRMGSSGEINCNALHFRLYNKVWNEWFRSQQLQDSVTVNVDDGPDAATDYALLKRCKRPDYFTRCLPAPQLGDAVEIPLGTTTPVRGTGKALSLTDGTSALGLFSGATYKLRGDTGAYNVSVGAAVTPTTDAISSVGIGVKTTSTNTGLEADLSSATAATINEWREAFQLQRLLERDARGGTRYCEILQSHWGVTDPSNAVLQRSEYLGGSSNRVTVLPVAQTESSDASTPQGSLTGVGYVQAGCSWTKSFTEHCTLLGLVQVRGDVTYQQGQERMWNRQTRYDYYMPVLAHLGEQEVLNKEIFVQATAADDNVFGYQERWSEYRTKRSYITGWLRSDYGASLDPWHLSEDFSALPVLGPSFIQDSTPVSRVVADAAAPEFLYDSAFKLTCIRAMPTFSVPGMIDHF